MIIGKHLKDGNTCGPNISTFSVTALVNLLLGWLIARSPSISIFFSAYTIISDRKSKINDLALSKIIVSSYYHIMFLNITMNKVSFIVDIS
jgi:hypothetical protein